MPEDKNNSSDKFDYRPVRQAADYFEAAAEQEKLGSNRHFFLSTIFNLILNKVYASLLRFVENIIGERVFVSVDELLLPGISMRTKKLAASFLRKKIEQTFDD